MNTFKEFTFPFPTDCVEFNSNNILAVGMYKLENDNKRIGKISFLPEQNNFEETPSSIILNNGGILDMKWLDSSNLITSTSTSVSLINYPKMEISSNLTFDQSDLNLSVDILNNKSIVTTSKGMCHLIDLTMKTEQHLSWKAHDLETWCGVFIDENLVATGSDDFLMKIWDLRISIDATPIKINKYHQAGVCSITPVNENIIATGSYDKHIRIFDKRNLLKPIKEVGLNSGAWRIKSKNDKLLVAAMNDGFYIFDINLNQLFHSPSDSLAYGCSFSSDSSFIAGASFYDCKVKIWKNLG